MAFTPGPWFRSGVRQKVDGRDNHSVVATVDGKEIVIASVWYDPRTHEGYDDARLMAAAPEMLSALKVARDGLYVAVGEACDIPGFDPAEHVAIKQIDAAITNAIGGTRLGGTQ